MPAPRHDSSETVLKTGVKRTVYLQSEGPGGPRVTKEFHGQGLGGVAWIGAPGDWRRASSERSALAHARKAGLPVPRPTAVERSARGSWELTMEAIRDARPLSDVLEDLFARPMEASGALQEPVHRLAEQLGALLLLVEAAGFVHADPHPGNVLMDADGKLWIIDVARSRVGASGARVEASIEKALSRMRELTPRTFRRRVALAWRGVRADAEWSRRIEADATLFRVREMRERVAVWRRDSSATEVRAIHGGPGPGPGRAVHVRERGPTAPRGWMTRLESGPESHIHAIWDTLVRTKLHRLPCGEPRSLSLTAPFRVQFDMPAATSPPSPEAVRIVRQQLRDRGLTVEPLREGGERFFAGPDGIARISPFTRLVEVRESPSEGGRP
ncbi:3-deoxy-D-manno-octulosonic-acid kinase [Planctomycetes bacterium Poly30]|uniref:non-specific serine/threonine protein kinase n=1 Tax=Saltatorellus ferox TaxID=2528018 RepID=A0A518EQ43_9BACT|nr:3-deoxy-D-manno-octulosonic-acid kinase [Planctomycetes bacterium Poly30]